MEVRRGHRMAGRKRVLSVFQTVSIQMPCFRCRLVNISKGLHPPTCVTGSCSCEKEFLLSLRKGEDENMFFLFAWSEDKVTEAMIPPFPPISHSGRGNVSVS